MRLKALDLWFLFSGCALYRSFLAFRLLDLHILQLAIALEDMEDIVSKPNGFWKGLNVFQLVDSQDFSIANAGGIKLSRIKI